MKVLNTLWEHQKILLITSLITEELESVDRFVLQAFIRAEKKRQCAVLLL